jgi:hypothetical protein
VSLRIDLCKHILRQHVCVIFLRSPICEFYLVFSCVLNPIVVSSAEMSAVISFNRLSYSSWNSIATLWNHNFGANVIVKGVRVQVVVGILLPRCYWFKVTILIVNVEWCWRISKDLTTLIGEYLIYLFSVEPTLLSVDPF